MNIHNVSYTQPAWTNVYTLQPAVKFIWTFNVAPANPELNLVDYAIWGALHEQIDHGRNLGSSTSSVSS